MNTQRTVGLSILCPDKMEFADLLISSLVAAPPPFNVTTLPAQGTILPIFGRERLLVA
ncbi:MAG: hypothetical protein M3Y39_14185 [Chloroflexota bacterium]|nr:hypothetical protein [Chloroflexota bacterium]